MGYIYIALVRYEKYIVKHSKTRQWRVNEEHEIELVVLYCRTFNEVRTKSISTSSMDRNSLVHQLESPLRLRETFPSLKPIRINARTRNNRCYYRAGKLPFVDPLFRELHLSASAISRRSSDAGSPARAKVCARPARSGHVALFIPSAYNNVRRRGMEWKGQRSLVLGGVYAAMYLKTSGVSQTTSAPDASLRFNCVALPERMLLGKWRIDVIC